MIPQQPLRVAEARHVLEVIVEREAVGHRELRQVVLPRRNGDVAALGDEQRVLHRLRIVAEHLRHLLGRRRALGARDLLHLDLDVVAVLADQDAHPRRS